MLTHISLIRCTLLGACTSLLASACSRGTELEPAKAANTAGRDVAYTSIGNVLVAAKGDTWSGEAEVRKHVTPVLLEVHNSSDQPLRVRYENISLVSASGETFSALPPFDVRGSVEKTVDRLVPKFGYERVAVAPYLGYVYEGLEVEPQSSYMDLEYYDHLYDTWEVEIPLPTKHMQEVALPEAQVNPRGELSGYVYFEQVPESAEQVTLNIELVNADSGQSLGTASIPFDVDD